MPITNFLDIGSTRVLVISQKKYKKHYRGNTSQTMSSSRDYSYSFGDKEVHSSFGLKYNVI